MNAESHSHEIEMVRMAFAARQPEAFERAQRLRDKLVTQARGCMALVDIQQGMVSNGKEMMPWKGDWTSATDAMIRRTRDVVSESDRHLERALDLMGKASTVSDLIEKFAGKHMRDPIEALGPTTELLSQIRHAKGDPVLRLRAMDKITDDHVRAAREIEVINRFIVEGMGLKAQNYGAKSEPGQELPSGRAMSQAERTEWLALLHARVYLRWSVQCRADVSLVLALAVEGVSLKVVAVRHGIAWGKALCRARGALDRYSIMRRGFRPVIDPTGRPAERARA